MSWKLKFVNTGFLIDLNFYMIHSNNLSYGDFEKRCLMIPRGYNQAQSVLAV